LSEHHFVEDGYLPSILPIAAAIGARTSRIRIASGLLLMPFHNPIRLAQDIATVDVITGGRFELGVGIGFKREEFEGFGVPSKELGARTDQSFDIIRRALAGETVTFKSEFFDFRNVKVTPEPIQKPHRPIWLGGFTPVALRRAVRFGDGFTVPEANRDVFDRYVSELRKANRPTDHIRFASGLWCLIVSDDPEQTFAEAADHIIYQANNYSKWLSAAGIQPLSEHLRDREQLRQSGLLKVVDPDSAISMIRNFATTSRSRTSIPGHCRRDCRRSGRKRGTTYFFGVDLTHGAIWMGGASSPVPFAFSPTGAPGTWTAPFQSELQFEVFGNAVPAPVIGGGFRAFLSVSGCFLLALLLRRGRMGHKRQIPARV
jgi:alkanesulfonate monooxygenase SsuD/methylene tetrahydromethanopterin reductase-like flavin-dependent oxidoreductase (luciferase family)